MLNPQCSMKLIPLRAEKLTALPQRIHLFPMRIASIIFLACSFWVPWPAAGADGPQIVEIWPGKVPDESGDIGAERFRMSPKLDRKQVEVTEPTQMITDVTKPTITIYQPPKD